MKKKLNQNVQEYLNVVNSTIYANNKNIQAYIKKQCSDVFKTKKGFLIEFEKPRIETRFCFGYGLNGQSTEEEQNDAFCSADIIEKDKNYFIEKNLQEINRKIKFFKNARKLFLLQRYEKTNKIASIYGNEFFGDFPEKEKQILQELDEEERLELLKICESEKEKFLKRLNTYLNRYGLTKVNARTYLVD